MPALLTIAYVLTVSFWVILLGGEAEAVPDLNRFMETADLRILFPKADRLGQAEGEPSVAPALAGGKTVGYIFLNSDFAGATGYSGKPIHILVGIGLDGTITGAQLVEHHEPIVLVGIPEERIRKVIDGYRGRNISALVKGEESDGDIDIVSGATVTVMVIDDSILRSAIKVARRYGLGGLEAEQKTRAGKQVQINYELLEQYDWDQLTRDKAVTSLKISLDDINKAFEESGDLVAAQRPEKGDPQEIFIDLNTALVSVPSIGLSLLGAREYANLKKELDEGQSAILLMGRGRYSFRGSGFVRGGLFDRFHLIQGDNSVRFTDKQYKRLSRVAAPNSPDFSEVALLTIPKNSGFDPTEPWRIQLLVGRATGPRKKAFLTFDFGYRVPEKFIKTTVVEPKPQSVTKAQKKKSAPSNFSVSAEPLWEKLWKQKKWEVAVLAIALLILTGIFFFQDWLVKRPVIADRVRLGFLAFTLFGIGFYLNAQLSVVNVMTFFNALITDFSWSYFLLEPLIFVMWFAVAASLLFWGRGAFCGWLCPFGALQELLSRASRALKVPQVKVPWWLHERLWPVKYIIFLVIFGVSLNSLAFAEKLAEVEPFKTAIILKFVREWPYVLFAVALLSAGLFVERFYCRYLCPLGAALAIPGKLRLFEWLRRYKHCGSPCQLCAGECMVQAIHPEGQINPNECLYCLQCQITYHDGTRCPVVIQKRLRQERFEPAQFKPVRKQSVDLKSAKLSRE